MSMMMTGGTEESSTPCITSTIHIWFRDGKIQLPHSALFLIGNIDLDDDVYDDDRRERGGAHALHHLHNPHLVGFIGTFTFGINTSKMCSFEKIIFRRQQAPKPCTTSTIYIWLDLWSHSHSHWVKIQLKCARIIKEIMITLWRPHLVGSLSTLMFTFTGGINTTQMCL